MAISTATTGDLEAAQRIVIAKCLMATEYNQPCVAFGTTRFKLGKGEKSMTIPNVGQVSAQALTDGVDLVDSVDIGLAYVEAAPDEVGMKFILTDKLVRQMNEDVFGLIGNQLGNGMARKRDVDVITLFASLSLGVGADNATLHMSNAAGMIAYAVAQKFPNPMVVIHHPNALGELVINSSAIGTSYYAGIMQGFSEELLRNYWKININGVNFFHSGEIDKITGTDSGYGAILSKSALCFIEGRAPLVEREKDISLRGWEVVVTSDYGCFELDDSMGAPMRYEIGALSTT